MKRLFVVILIVILLCCINVSVLENLTLDAIFPKSTVEVYLGDKSGLTNFKKIDNGEGEIIFANIDSLSYILNNTVNVNGFTIRVFSNKNILEKIKPVNVKKCEWGMYGYSRILGNFAKKYNIENLKVNIKNQDYNFQCVQGKGVVYIGFPLLLGGY